MGLERDKLLGFRAGNREAIEVVVHEYGAMVRAVARRYFCGLFDQEEAVQEIWLHAIENRAALDPERLDTFGGWLSTMAHRKCLDRLRRKGLPAAAVDAEAAAPEAADPVERAELAAAVRAFKARLGPDSQRFFELCFEQGLGYREIAALTGRPTWRCKYLKKVIVRRARRDRRLTEALGRFRPRGQG